jgi:hypothetical protein
MHSNNQRLLVVGTVEDADPGTFRKAAVGAPEKIMIEFFSPRLFETNNLAALCIDPRHHVTDGAVLAPKPRVLTGHTASIFG